MWFKKHSPKKLKLGSATSCNIVYYLKSLLIDWFVFNTNFISSSAISWRCFIIIENHSFLLSYMTKLQNVHGNIKNVFLTAAKQHSLHVLIRIKNKLKDLYLTKFAKLQNSDTKYN